jgi:rhamnogalacturonyl hydrolase YesR
MVRNEINALRRLHGMLEHDRVNSREEFRDMMTAAFMHGRLELRGLSDDLGFSFSAVFRWLEGKSAPHPSLWPRVVEWVMGALARKIKALELEVAGEEAAA